MNEVIAKRNNEIVYREGDTVVKLFNKGFLKTSVLNEALNQARIEEAGVNIPKIIEVKKIDDQWAIVMDYIKGETLDELMKKNPNKTDEYLNLFVDIQLGIHSKRSQRLDSLRDKMNRKVSASKGALDATLRFDLHARIDSAPRHEKVCHCDFIPDNIIISENGAPYITGWSHAAQGNGATDAAITYLDFYIAGQIENADKYLDLYCKKSDTAKQYVQTWMPVAAAAKITDYQEGGVRDLLMRFIDVVDSL
ncbi:MAG: phosphotransferase [Elusimicrobiota bacterium]|jgi:serine/threonine protein kinase|nr:phosphotransferase [Elusimicrobiota bacterium]